MAAMVLAVAVLVSPVLNGRERAVLLEGPTPVVTSATDSPSSVVAFVDLVGRWDLVSGESGGRPVAVPTDGRPHRVTFVDGDRGPAAAAWWGCNDQAYRLAVSGNGYAVTGAGHTEVGCGAGNAI